jgi:hypothetical protein
MKEYFEVPKDPQFVVGEEVEFKMYEYDFETRLTKDIWVKAKIQICYYFENTARIHYFRPNDGQLKYREIEFSSLRKLPIKSTYKNGEKSYFDTERIAKQIDRLKMLEAIADVLSRIYFYGNFKIETLNEKIIAGMLNDLGLFPCTESDIFRRPEYADLFERYRNYEIVKPLNTHGGSTCP